MYVVVSGYGHGLRMMAVQPRVDVPRIIRRELGHFPVARVSRSEERVS